MKSILLCGRIGSGKTTVARDLSKRFHIPLVSFGSLILSKAAEKGLSPTRENLQNLGYELFTSMGSRYLIEEAIKYSKQEISDKVIFDGVRHELVLSEIKARYGSIFLIFLKADESIRFRRYKLKQQTKELVYNDFLAIDRHPIEQGTDKLQQFANVTIDGSSELGSMLSGLYNNTEDFLSKA